MASASFCQLQFWNLWRNLFQIPNEKQSFYVFYMSMVLMWLLHCWYLVDTLWMPAENHMVMPSLYLKRS